MKTIATNLTVYGTAHCVEDMACAGILFSTAVTGIFSAEVLTYMFIGYNLLAFGLQIFAGFFTDKLKAPRQAAVTGLMMTGIAAVIFNVLPIPSIILAGIGNAIFHVGGGVISLHLTPQKATAPGIFVAPGALGLATGTILGKNGSFTGWPFLAVIIVLCVLIFLIKKPVTYSEQTTTVPGHSFKGEYIIYIILFVIAARSLVGFAVAFPWKSDIPLLFMLTLAVVLGKGLGGYLADRFGWAKVTIGSLLLSIPLLNLGASVPVLGMAGMFLFNITMPVTLTMVSNMLPGKPGTAFGLTCMALIFGALPSFSTLKTSIGNPIFIDIVIAISAVTLWLAFRYYSKADFTIERKKDYHMTTNQKEYYER